MARLVIVLGNSGSGKSTSLRSFKKADINVISPLGKELPFQTDIKTVLIKDIDQLRAAIPKTKAPVVVIDDANYYLTLYKARHLMDKNPYEAPKYVAHTFTGILEDIVFLETDQTFYIFAHMDKDAEGYKTFKTTGAFIRDDLMPEGMTNIVLESRFDDTDGYVFVVKRQDDKTPVKAPMGMFDTETVPNDLKEVNNKINAYYKQGAK